MVNLCFVLPIDLIFKAETGKPDVSVCALYDNIVRWACFVFGERFLVLAEISRCRQHRLNRLHLTVSIFLIRSQSNKFCAFCLRRFVCCRRTHTCKSWLLSSSVQLIKYESCYLLFYSQLQRAQSTKSSNWLCERVVVCRWILASCSTRNLKHKKKTHTHSTVDMLAKCSFIVHNLLIF